MPLFVICSCLRGIQRQTSCLRKKRKESSWFGIAQVGVEYSILNRTSERLQRSGTRGGKDFDLAKSDGESTIIKLFPANIPTWICNHDNQVITPKLNVDSSDSEEV